jgi:hypothetical protein
MALLPCQVSSDHCWGHHPGSGDCLEFRPRGCTEAQIEQASKNEEDKEVKHETD